MSYSYEAQRASVFTEDGTKMLLAIRDQIKRCLDTAGAVTMDQAIKVCSGDSWKMLAAVDYLVEIGELREIPQQCAGQDRIFVRNNNG